jgi:3-dehydroquinate dehydratase type I
MAKSFLNREIPMLTVMLQCETPQVAIGRVRNANFLGADAYGLQIESLKPEYHTPETYQRIFGEMQGRPCYVTMYRGKNNTGLTDEELAQKLVVAAESGAVLCDVMGDMFSKHPEELTDNEDAIKKQMELIDKLHNMGAEVLMSSHLYKYAPAERVLEIALEQKRRGADIIKIVTFANDMEQQIENLRITNLLKNELGAPFLFLSGGECSIHRRLGITLGCSMALCVYEHDHLSTPTQPLLSTMKNIRDNIDF